jgi:hypothetical protein
MQMGIFAAYVRVAIRLQQVHGKRSLAPDSLSCAYQLVKDGVGASAAFNRGDKSAL